jgi:hypothetical protein
MTHLMPSCCKGTLHILQTELADPQPPIWYARILLRERRVIPCFDIVWTEPNAPYSEDARFKFERWHRRPSGCGWHRGSVEVKAFRERR